MNGIIRREIIGGEMTGPVGAISIGRAIVDLVRFQGAHQLRLRVPMWDGALGHLGTFTSHKTLATFKRDYPGYFHTEAR